MRKSLVALSILAATALPTVVSAADYSDDIHKNDYKWLQFNIMQSVDNKIPFGNQNDTYLEIEFGGRSGIVDLYAYVDVFDIFNSKDSDRHDGDNFFMKFAPRFSIDGMLGKDLSFGPVQELYISTVTNVGDGALFDHNIGLGSDIMVPWFGKIGVNTYARYVRENYGADNEGKWDGFQISTNWFKPFVNFDNGSFIAYQGYLDYKFGADEISDQAGRSDTSLEWFNGFYWHSDQWAVGYGLKVYEDMALLEDGGFAGETSGIGHYFDVTYKF